MEQKKNPKGKWRTAEEIKALDLQRNQVTFLGITILNALGKEEYDRFVDKYCAARVGRGKKIVGQWGFEKPPTAEELEACNKFLAGDMTFQQLKLSFGMNATIKVQEKIGRICSYMASVESGQKESAANG